MIAVRRPRKTTTQQLESVVTLVQERLNHPVGLTPVTMEIGRSTVTVESWTDVVSVESLNEFPVLQAIMHRLHYAGNFDCRLNTQPHGDGSFRLVFTARAHGKQNEK